MKLKSIASNLLKNKMVLNIVSVIALINVLGYMMMGEIDLVLFYIILAVVIKHFSHNMIVVLGVPIILINFISLKFYLKWNSPDYFIKLLKIWINLK